MAYSDPEMYAQNSDDHDSPVSSVTPDEPTFSRQQPSQYEHVSEINASPRVKKALAKYNMSISNPNYDSNYNDTIGIVMIRTTKGDELTAFGCFNIYIALYVMSFYHLLINIPYFILAWIIFDLKSIKTETLNTTKCIIIILCILFGIIRIFTFIFGMYLIPPFKTKKVSDLIAYRPYKHITKLWLTLLLISPILCDLILVLGYIENNMNNNTNQAITLKQSEKDTAIIFIVILFELLLSIYLFFVTNTFVSLKWPNLRQ